MSDITGAAKLGSAESELLKWVADRDDGCSVREAFEAFQVKKGMARTTVLTMLERLHDKGCLSKTKSEEEGVFRYRALQSSGEILRRQVTSFVRDRLQGQWAPLMASFCDEKQLSAEEKSVLQAIIKRLDRESAAGSSEEGSGL